MTTAATSASELPDDDETPLPASSPSEGRDLLVLPVVRPIERAASGSGRRISDRVYDELLTAIREVRLRPGDSLSEIELAVRLGVSRTPLRDATSRLADQGLVLVVPQVGTTVALIDVHAVEEACFIRAALESAAFREACLAPVRDVAGLRSMLDRQRAAVAAKNGDEFFRADEDLHEEIFRLGGRASVWALVLRSKVQLDRVRRLILPEAIATDELVAEHTLLVDLLETGDCEGGRLLIGAHSRHVLHQVPHVRARHPAYFLT